MAKHEVTVFVAVGVTYSIDDETGSYERMGGMYVEGEVDPIADDYKVWDHNANVWRHVSWLSDVVNDGRFEIQVDADGAVAERLPSDKEIAEQDAQRALVAAIVAAG